MITATIIDINVQDIRFPTSKDKHGSDAMHTDPDYSCAYVTITTDNGLKGYGLTFTLGRGTEIVALACKSLYKFVKGRTTTEIYNNFAAFWRKLTSDSQLRWIGPEKGVLHMATGAIVNALWDLWARIEDKPVWKLLSDMTPEELISVIDFRYIEDIINPEQAKELLEHNRENRKYKERDLRERGYRAYTTDVAWLGYTDQQVEELCKKYLKENFTAFKIKVGHNLDDDIRRCSIVRRMIGNGNKLMVDANQVWGVSEAINWMKKLEKFQPYWIEEPTSPDDILGHGEIQRALKPTGIQIATGEMCSNRIMFKQFMLHKAMDVCQIDAARVGGINEVLAIYLMAYMKNIPVCPHAGGVGLCEMVQHLQMWDYVCLSQTQDDRMIEYVNQQHSQFEDPVTIKNGYYMPPTEAGYSTKLKDDAIKNYIYPDGDYWRENK